MDSTLLRRASRALAALLACAALPASAFNHTETVAPITTPRFNVACSNVEHDMARLASLGGTPTDYWEGREVNGTTRYITDILARPDTAVVFTGTPPLKPFMYPQNFGRKVQFAAIVCYPTPRTNTDPNYALPGGAGTVPHMQPAGTSPKFITEADYATALGLPVPPDFVGFRKMPLIVYSHGLGGSPVGPGYLDVAVGLASQGFVVAGIFHADNRFSKVRIEDLADLAYALAFFPFVLEMQAIRPVGLKAMTDTLLGDSRWSAGIDPARIGGFGASLGGQAMIHLLGARISSSLGGSCDDTVVDTRIKAAVGYVPYAGQTFLPAFCSGQEGAGQVDRPFLGMSGTDDTTAPIGMAKQAINRFQSSRYMVELEGGKHELRPEDAPDVVTWTVTFLNASLEVPQDAAMARLIRMRSVAGGANDRVTIDVHVPQGGNPLPGQEYRDPASGHYAWAFSGPDALFLRDAGWEFARHALRPPSLSPTATATVPVCRDFRQGVRGLAVGEVECGIASRARGSASSAVSFYAVPLQANGTCASGLLQLMRVVEPSNAVTPPRGPAPQRFDRLTTSNSTVADMVREGWRDAGPIACVAP